jgi:hypothetical protein
MTRIRSRNIEARRVSNRMDSDLLTGHHMSGWVDVLGIDAGFLRGAIFADRGNNAKNNFL